MSRQGLRKWLHIDFIRKTLEKWHWKLKARWKSFVEKATDWMWCLYFPREKIYAEIHSYRLLHGLEPDRCSCMVMERNGPYPRSANVGADCWLSQGYRNIPKLTESNTELCKSCYSRTSDALAVEQITSPEGFIFTTNRRSIEHGLYNRCPLCRLIWDKLVSGHWDEYQFLFCLPYCGKITLAMRSGSSIFQSAERHDFDLLEISYLKPLKTGDKNFPGFEGNRLMLLSVCAPSEDPAAADISVRPAEEMIPMEVCFNVALGWLDKCGKYHANCQPKAAEDQVLPTRLIDVSSQQPKLCYTAGMKGQYVALSYCWGVIKQPVMTLTDTIESLMTDGLPLEKLPTTVMDAIKSTQRLGIQYLWIDVLCIIQDDKKDKKREIAQMQHIFSNSFVTIIAASASNCTDGFLSFSQIDEDGFITKMKPGLKTPSFKMPWRCRDGQLGSLQVLPWTKYEFKDEPVSKRAWTLEERLLSPRLLIFGQHQVLWQCQMLPLISATGSFSNLGTDNLGRLDDAVFLSTTSNRRQQNMVSEVKIAQSTQHLQWRRLVEDYTARSLTDPDDKLRAFSGIASRFCSSDSQLTYLAGLIVPKRFEGYEKLFGIEMMWTISDDYFDRLENFNRDHCRTSDDKLSGNPSFSWSSVNAPIQWWREDVRHVFQTETESPRLQSCQILGYGSKASSFEAYGGIIDGSAWLKFRGPVHNLDQCECYHSTIELVDHGFSGLKWRGDLDFSFGIEEISTSSGKSFNQVRGKLSVTCLRLTPYGGLLLERCEHSRAPPDSQIGFDGTTAMVYRRVGTFSIVREPGSSASTRLKLLEWMDRFETQTVILV